MPPAGSCKSNCAVPTDALSKVSLAPTAFLCCLRFAKWQGASAQRKTDGLHWQVRWNNEQQTSEGAQRSTVQIRFFLNRSKLYSFTFRT